MTTPKTPDLAAVVARVRGEVESFGAEWTPAANADLEALCTAAEQAESCVAITKDLVRSLADAMDAEKAAQADLAALRAERDRLQVELDGDCYHCSGYIKRNVVLHKENAALRERLAVAEAIVARCTDCYGQLPRSIQKMIDAARTPGGPHEGDLHRSLGRRPCADCRHPQEDHAGRCHQIGCECAEFVAPIEREMQS